MHKCVLKTIFEVNQHTREYSKSYLESTFGRYEVSHEMPAVDLYELAFPKYVLYSKFQIY